jgi:prephenate dehydrogenase/cyclohexadieny/prephenate dehydrogenase
MMKNILIIGCGLIGSSVLRAVYSRKLSKNIYIYEKSKKNVSIIKKLKIGFKIINKFNNINTNFDLVIFCTPMSQYSKIISKINKFLTNETIVTDVGSTKELSSKNVKKQLKKNTTWIPSHPIAGSEVSGAEYGEKNLFKNKWCVLIKEKNIKKIHLSRLKSFWEKLGSKVIMMNPKEHDIIFSITSHLPHLIAYNLVTTATDFEKGKKYNLIKYSAGGLRDFSRIAASNEIMWRDIFFSNQKNIIFAINLFIKNLNLFKNDIKVKNNNKIIKKLIDTKKVRKKIIQLKQDINKPDFGRF